MDGVQDLLIQPESTRERLKSGFWISYLPGKGAHIGVRTSGRKVGLEDVKGKWSQTSSGADLIYNLILGGNECIPRCSA